MLLIIYLFGIFVKSLTWNRSEGAPAVSPLLPQVDVGREVHVLGRQRVKRHNRQVGHYSRFFYRNLKLLSCGEKSKSHSCEKFKPLTLEAGLFRYLIDLSRHGTAFSRYSGLCGSCAKRLMIWSRELLSRSSRCTSSAFVDWFCEADG